MSDIQSPLRTIDQIGEEELEYCFDGTTDPDMVRRLVDECLTSDGWVDEDDFAGDFASEIEGFIDADEGTDEWNEAWEVNQQWGYTIAENINAALSIEEPEEYKE